MSKICELCTYISHKFYLSGILTLEESMRYKCYKCKDAEALEKK